MALVSRRLSRNPRLQAAANNNPPLRIGATGEAVEILQCALIDLGFAMPLSTGSDSLSPDGIYGNETAGTVKKFQLQQGLLADGIAGRQTLGRLDQIYSASEAQRYAAFLLEVRAMYWT
jgi:peptidoglycan hydrolase-like protein with peptidoglycan-binding domain